MCFKTAGLKAETATEAGEVVNRRVASLGARFSYRKARHTTRSVILTVGNASYHGAKVDDDFQRADGGGAHSQIFDVAGLRQFAAQLNTLADQLEA